MKKNLIQTSLWALIALYMTYAFLQSAMAALFLETLKIDLGVTTCCLTGPFIVGFALMQIPVGVLLDRYHVHWVSSGGLFLMAVGNMILALLSSHKIPFLFSLAFFLQGVGASAALLTVARWISQKFSSKRFPIFFGLTFSVSSFLSALVYTYFSRVFHVLTWKDVYGHLSQLGWILFILTLLFLRERLPNKGKASFSLEKNFSFFRSKQVWLSALCAAASLGALTACMNLWYLAHHGFLNSMILLGFVIGAPVLGWISNEMKSRKLALHLSLSLGVILLLTIFYSPLFRFDFVARIVPVLIGFFLSGSILFYTCISELSNAQHRTTAIGFTHMLVFLTSLAIFLSGELFFMAYLCLLIAVLLSYFVKETFQLSSK